MSYREQYMVELMDRRFSLAYLMELYREGSIHFPHLSKVNTADKTTVSNMIGAIWSGIPMPVIYASELQNGDFLVMESEGKLMHLMEYVKGDFSVPIVGMPWGDRECYYGELDERERPLAAVIMRTAFLFRIISYQTPRYLHMETGLFHEKWTLKREQEFRDALYDVGSIQNLRYFRDKVTMVMPKEFLTGNTDLLDEYMVLYMMLFWGIYRKILWVGPDAGEQELLDAGLSEIDKERIDWIDFLEILQSCAEQYFITISVFSDRSFSPKHLKDRDIKYRAKKAGLFLCLYDMQRHRYTDSTIADIFRDKRVEKELRNTKITAKNIDMLLQMGKELIE